LTTLTEGRDLASVADSCRFALKVVPRASCDEVAGWTGDELRLRLRAPALEGRANEALREFLAERLGLGRSAVRIVVGEKSRRKVVQVEGLGLNEVRRRLVERPA